MNTSGSGLSWLASSTYYSTKMHFGSQNQGMCLGDILHIFTQLPLTIDITSWRGPNHLQHRPFKFEGNRLKAPGTQLGITGHIQIWNGTLEKLQQWPYLLDIIAGSNFCVIHFVSYSPIFKENYTHVLCHTHCPIHFFTVIFSVILHLVLESLWKIATELSLYSETYNTIVSVSKCWYFRLKVWHWISIKIL